MDSSIQSGMFSGSPLTRMLLLEDHNAEEMQSLSRKERVFRGLAMAGSHSGLVGLTVVVHALVFFLGWINYDNKTEPLNARTAEDLRVLIAKACTVVLHFDVAILLLPVCRTLMSLLGGTPLRNLLQNDSAVSYHKLVAWSMAFFTWVHVISHWTNYAQLASSHGQGIKGFFVTLFTTGSGWSGFIMLLSLMVIAFASTERVRTLHWQRFWSIHHVFILFFVFFSIHGAFSVSEADRSETWVSKATFWRYWLVGGLVYLVERVLRDVRGRHKTHIAKVVQHPSDVVEIQFSKQQTAAKVGQHIYLCCPEVSAWQWRAFVLTSAPEEDFLAIHVNCCDGFTKALATSVGCDFGYAKAISADTSSVVGIDEKAVKLDVDPSIRNLLPPVSIDGPFGTGLDRVFEKEVAILVGVGHNVTAFASILKSIWYRQNFAHEKTALRKVYFFWLCDDLTGLEWFKALGMAVEAQDIDSNIEIHPYFTSSYKAGGAAEIADKNVDQADKVFAGLRGPSISGRPNWDAIFKAVLQLHGPAEREVLSFGSQNLWADLMVMSGRYSRKASMVESSKGHF